MSPGYTRLTGTRVGAGAREALSSLQAGDEGAVIQVFDRTAYLRLGPDDAVVVVGTADVRDGPLTVPTDARTGFEDMVEAGDDCRVLSQEPVTLSIGDRLVLELGQDHTDSRSTPDDQFYPLTDIHEDGPVWSQARTVLEEARAGPGEDGLDWLDELGEGTDDRIGAVADAMTTALTDGPDHADLGALEWLVGRGPGATPSGDDVLSGMAYLLARTTEGRAQERVRETVDRLLDGGRRTTEMSAALLEQAALGRAPEPVADCCEAVLGPEAAAGAAVEAMDEIGHHSGQDALVGMLIAVLCVAPQIDG